MDLSGDADCVLLRYSDERRELQQALRRWPLVRFWRLRRYRFELL